MSRPTTDVKSINAVLPDNPEDMAWYLRDAHNYITYIENAHLGKLVLERDDISAKIDLIESAVKLRRDSFLGSKLLDIPKEYLKTVGLTTQYVDYTIYPEETGRANESLSELKSRLSDVESKIVAWRLVKEQYERAISTGTVILAWTKATLRLER